MVTSLRSHGRSIARSLTELTGRVRLATFQTGLLGLLSPVLTALGRRHPALRVEVFQVEPQIALPRLLAHEYDMVLVEEFPHQPLPRPAEVDYRSLFLDPMRIAVPPAERVDPDDVWQFVAGRPWVAEPPDTAARAWVESLCRDAGFEPDIRYTTADLLVHRQLITDGHAVGILPDLLSNAGSSAPTLVDIPAGTTPGGSSPPAAGRPPATRQSKPVGRPSSMPRLLRDRVRDSTSPFTPFPFRCERGCWVSARGGRLRDHHLAGPGRRRGARGAAAAELIAVVLAFAAGSLITALSFELFLDAYEAGGALVACRRTSRWGSPWAARRAAG